MLRQIPLNKTLGGSHSTSCVVLEFLLKFGYISTQIYYRLDLVESYCFKEIETHSLNHVCNICILIPHLTSYRRNKMHSLSKISENGI